MLLRVINILGQEVEINNESFTGSVFFEVFNDGSVEKKFSRDIIKIYSK